MFARLFFSKKISLYRLIFLVLLSFTVFQETVCQQYTSNFSSAPTLIPGPYWIDTAQVTLGGQIYYIVSGGNGGWAYKSSGGESNSANIQYDCAATTTVRIIRKGGGRFNFYGAWLKYTDYTTGLYNTPPFVTVTYNGSTDPVETYGPNTTTVLSKNVSVIAVTIYIVGLIQLNFDNLIVGPSPVIIPFTTTNSVSSYNATTATLGSNVTDDGGGTIVDRGIVYNTTGNPSTSDTKVQIGNGTGNFSQLITGLTGAVKYYVRAYAINSAGIAYGNEVNFTTEGPFVLQSTHNFNGGSWSSTTNQTSPYIKFIQGWNVTAVSTGSGNASISRVTGSNSADAGAAIRALAATSAENLSFMSFKVSEGTHFDLQNFKFRYATRTTGTSFSNIVVTGYVNGLPVSGAIALLPGIGPISANPAYNTFDFSAISQFRNIDEFRITATDPFNSARLYYIDLDLLTVKNIFQISSNAALTNINLSTGALSPAFDSTTTSYSATAGNSITTITVTPFTADSLSTVKVNGQIVTAGNPSELIQLVVGENLITVDVIAQDGITVKSYTIIVNRAASAKATLSGITPSTGELSPAFDSSIISYSTTVANEITTYSFTPLVSDTNATVRVNGQITDNGSLSQLIDLAVGENLITVDVTAQDGITVKSYTIIVNRAASAKATLSGITPVTGELSPAFNSSVISYSTTVANEITTYSFTPLVSDTNATVRVNGQITDNGSLSQLIDLAVGENLITVDVTAQDGITVKSYTIIVNRAASAKATLSDITPVTGELFPAFDSSIISYSTAVENEITTYSFTPLVSDTNATVRVNGQITDNGSLSQLINLAVGENLITVDVTAQDGITVKSYKITVNRAASTKAALSGLVPGTGNLSPAFDSSTTSYTTTVSNEDTTYSVTPFAADSTATVKVNGHIVNSGSISDPINLSVGENIITTEVTAQDGTTVSTYSIIVTRRGSAVAALDTLTLSIGVLTPAFDTSVTSYTIDVDNSITTFSITPKVSDTTATVRSNGQIVPNDSSSAPVNLIVGDNIITLQITAQDGTTIKTYTINVRRLSSPLPVTLTNFRAYEKGSAVEVSWTTHNQINIDKFVVEKSPDGNHFIIIGEIASKINTSGSLYTWEDKDPFDGDNFYRIKPVDKNGLVVYSTIVKININKKDQFVKIFPNPLKNKLLNIQLGNMPAGKFNLALYNVYGKVIFTSSISSSGASTFKTFQLPATLSSGIYNVQLKNGNNKVTRMVMIE